MIRFKLSDKQRQEFRKLARRLPQTTTSVKSSETVTGIEANRLGLTPPDGVIAFDPYKIYNRMINVPDNHYRRICHAWQSAGKDGVQAYVNKFAPKVEEVKPV